MQNTKQNLRILKKDVKLGVGGVVGRIGEGLEDRQTCLYFIEKNI